MLVPLIVSLHRLVVVASLLVASPSRPLVTPHSHPLVAPHSRPLRPLTVPPSCCLIAQAGCCVASCRVAVLSSRRPLNAPPSSRLIAQVGCCVASRSAAVLSSCCAALSSSHCAALSSSHRAIWLLRFHGTTFLRKGWGKICYRCRISRNGATRTGLQCPSHLCGLLGSDACDWSARRPCRMIHTKCDEDIVISVVINY